MWPFHFVSVRVVLFVLNMDKKTSVGGAKVFLRNIWCGLIELEFTPSNTFVLTFSCFVKHFRLCFFSTTTRERVSVYKHFIRGFLYNKRNYVKMFIYSSFSDSNLEVSFSSYIWVTRRLIFEQTAFSIEQLCFHVKM